jgi:hypothetical protein
MKYFLVNILVILNSSLNQIVSNAIFYNRIMNKNYFFLFILMLFASLGYSQSTTAGNDAAVLTVDSPLVFCAGNHDVLVTVANEGINQIDSVELHWELNGVAQPSFKYIGLIDTLNGLGSDFASVNIGPGSFAAGPNTVKVWTTLPNGVVDTVNTNDTNITVFNSAIEPEAVNTVISSLTSIVLEVEGVPTTATIDYEFGSYGFVQGNGTSGTSLSSRITLNSLTAGTDYEIFVRTDCGGMDTSDWVGPFLIQTARNIPFVEDFETFNNGIIRSPSTNSWLATAYDGAVGFGFGWEAEDANGANENSSNTGPVWDHTQFGISGGTYAYMETSGGSGGDSTELISPPIYIDPSYASVKLSFWYFLHGNNIDGMEVLIDTNGVENVLVNYAGQQQFSQADDWREFTSYLNGYSGKVVRIKFKGKNVGCCTGDIAVDDVALAPIPILNAGIAEIIDPKGVICATSSRPVVAVQNTGITTLTSIDVVRIINGNKDTTTFSLNLPTGDTAHLTLPVVTYSAGTTYDFEFYSIRPNGGIDGFNDDDTMRVGGFMTGLSGNYTINVGLPPSSSNFTSFAALENELKANGICGNVRVIVSPGVYNETLDLKDIAGLSASSRLTIDGVDSAFVELTNSLSSANAIINFDGVSYVTVKNMKLSSSVSSSYNWGVHFMGGSSNDSLLNLKVEMSRSNTFGVYCLGASSSLTDNSAEGDNANNITVMNCHLSGGDYSVHFEGPSSGAWNSGNKFVNNTLIAADDYGFYFDQQDSLEVTGNTIRGLRTSSSTSGTGIANFDGMNFKINANRIEVNYRGIYCTNANSNINPGRYAEIINNMVVSTNNVGINLTVPLKINIFHNSVNALGSETALLISGVGADSLDLRNNILVSGSGMALDIGTYVDSLLFDKMDNNVYRTNTGSVLIHEDGTDYADLASYQVAQPFLNTNSIETDPEFLSATDLHIIGGLVNDLGDNSVFVLTDIDGDSRPMSGSTNVDPGADEHDPPSCLRPVNFAFQDPTSDGFTITWDGDGTAFEYLIVPAGTSPSTGTYVSTSTDSVVVTGLLPDTLYDVYVREECARGVYSINQGPIQAPTARPLPYVEDFESFSLGVINNPVTNRWIVTPYDNFGWEIENSNGNNKNSAGTGPLYDHTQFGVSGGKYVFMETNGGTEGDVADFVSPYVYIDPSTTIFEVSYWYFLHGAEIDSIEFYVRSGGTETLLQKLVGEQQAAQSDEWIRSTYRLSGYGGQSIQLVVRGYNAICCTGDLAIDDVSFTVPENNDLELLSIETPNSGCGLGAAELVTIRFRNAGLLTQSSFSLGYEVNAGSPVIETYTGTVNPGDTVEYTFTATTDLSIPGDYDISGFTGLSGDANLGNDTAVKTVTHIPLISSFPYTEDFESGNGGWSSTGLNNSWELGTPAGSVINAAAGGTQAWVTDLTGNYNNNESSYVVGPCFDFTSIAYPEIKLDIWWNAENSYDGAVLQSSIDGGVTWQKVGSLGDPGNWYNDGTISGLNDLEPSQEGWTGSGTNGSGQWLNANHRLNGLGGVSDVMLRIAFGSDGSAVDEGFAFDNLVIQNVPADNIAVIGFTSSQASCGLGTTESVEIIMTNVGINPATTFPLSFSVDGGALVTETYTGTINAGDTTTYLFTATADLSAPGLHTLRGISSLAGDGDRLNDTTDVTIENIPVIASFPYFEGFESGNGGWSSGGVNNSWELGTPTGNVINSAAAGTESWVTDLDGTYNNNEESYVVGPCFDLSSLTDPQISMDIWWDSENSYDGAVLQSSVDGGITWQKVGALGDPGNWYNDGTINGLDNLEPSQEGWTNSSGGWVTAKHQLNGLGGAPGVRLRIAFGSDGSAVNDGFAFDNVVIQNVPADNIEMLAFINPQTTCGLSNAEAVEVRLVNLGINAASAFPISYSINGGALVTETYSGGINPGDTVTYLFTATADLSVPGTYELKAIASLSNDGDRRNDTVDYTVTNIPLVTTYPYAEGFESGNGGWVSGGTNNSWELGTPAGGVINSAATGTEAWMTNLDGSYNNNEDSYVIGPCFDFTSLSDPQITMDVWWATEFSYDGAVLQSSINGGATWQKVGALGDPNNWYNDGTINGLNDLEPSQEGWSGEGSNGSGTWVSARHRLNGLAGATSVRLRIAFGTDGSGVRDGFAFDNVVVQDVPAEDIEVLGFISPLNGCGLSNAETVELQFVNNGVTAVTSLPLSFSVDGGALNNETFTGTVNPGDTASYVFSATADLSVQGLHSLRGIASLVNDGNRLNDTLDYQVNHIPLLAVFPYMEGFESGNGGWTSGGVGNSWELGVPAGAVIDTAAGGTQAWVTDLDGDYSDNEDSYVISPCLDFTSLQAPQISMDIWWESENSYDGAVLQSSIDGGATWQKVGALGDPDNWYNDGTISGLNDLEPSQEGWTGRGSTGSGGWLTAKHELNGLGGESAVLLRIAFGSDGSAVDEGFAFDNIVVENAPSNNVELFSFISPQTNCGLGAAEAVEVQLINRGSAAITNFPIAYEVNGGTPVSETFTGSINPGDTMNYLFTSTVDLSITGTYAIKGYTSLLNDSDPTNDTVSYSVTNIPITTTFPYSEDFESGNGGWTTDGVNNSWELGAPAGSVINAAAGGTQAWVTDLDGDYNDNEDSYVLGPCFDFTNLLNPEIELDIWWESENSYDGAVLQSSIDGGTTWQKVGALGDPNNWYNDGTIGGLTDLEPSQEGWTGSGSTGSGGWLTAKHELNGLGGESAVLLRIAFGSDGSAVDEGFAFDNISISEAANVDLTILSIDAPRDNDCGLSATEEVIISVTNLGRDTAFGFPTSLIFNGSPIIETATDTIPPGDTVQYTYSNTYDLSSVGSYSFITTASHPDDVDNSNNAKAITVRNGLINSIPTIDTFNLIASQQTGQFSNYWTGTSSMNSAFEWYSNTGLTPSGAGVTGPDASSADGTYMYVEADSGSTGDIAWLTSPCYDISQVLYPAVVYNYHMFGANIDSLSIQIDTNGVWADLKVIRGQQQAANSDAFIADTINIGSFKAAGKVRIRFQVVKGNGAAGDVAVDNAGIIDNPTGIASQQYPLLNEISLHPNPVSDILTISLNQQQEKLSMEIRDVEGKLISATVLPESTSIKRLDVSSYAKGVYFISFTNRKERVIKRLIVK